MTDSFSYPLAVDPERVGTYPAVLKAGGGMVWDAVLEYRVWCHPERGAPDIADGNHYCSSFASYPDALAFAQSTAGADEPRALIFQKEFIDEPVPGQYLHINAPRLTEWPVAFLKRPQRSERTIPDFIALDAPSNRLDILLGLATH